jgi:hypothetical protein
MYRLDDLLLAHHIKQSTNPQDKVLVLIEISETRDDRVFSLDYCRSLRKIFTNVDEYLLISNSSLNLTYFTTISTSIPDLPSWIPDWTSTSTWNENHIRQLAQTNQPLYGCKADAPISPDKKTLEAHGFCIDRIDHVGRSHNFNHNNGIKALQIFHAWRKLVIDVKGNGKKIKLGSTFHILR